MVCVAVLFLIFMLNPCWKGLVKVTVLPKLIICRAFFHFFSLSTSCTKMLPLHYLKTYASCPHCNVKSCRYVLTGRETVTTVYGMPSSHAQFMSFFAVFLVLFLFFRYFHCFIDFALYFIVNFLDVN